MLHPLCNVIMPLWRNAGAKALGERREGRLVLSIYQFYWHNLPQPSAFYRRHYLIIYSVYDSQRLYGFGCFWKLLKALYCLQNDIVSNLLRGIVFICNGNCVSGFFLSDLAAVRISPEWVTSLEQGKPRGRIATFSHWTGMFWDGCSFLMTVVPLWLGRHCLITPREGGGDGLHWILRNSTPKGRRKQERPFNKFPRCEFGTGEQVAQVHGCWRYSGNAMWGRVLVSSIRRM